MKQFVWAFVGACLLVSCSIRSVSPRPFSNSTTSDFQAPPTRTTPGLYHLSFSQDPVRWQAWGNAVQQRAASEGKLLLLSIGYPACYWCDVMEAETFRNPAVAEFINEHFIAIKLDRDERPDLEKIYGAFCAVQQPKTTCNQPINAILLPDGRPIWSNTYMESDAFLKILEEKQAEYHHNPLQSEATAERLTSILKMPTFEAKAPTSPFAAFNPTTLRQLANETLTAADPENGGSRGEFKYASTTSTEFLMRYYYFSKDEKALQQVRLTLNKMAKGGLRDHVGGGFFSFTERSDWSVPSFEMPLHTNARLMSLYAKGYQLTGDSLYRQMVYEIFGFAKRLLYRSEGGFYSMVSSNKDQNSFTWNKHEIERILKYPALSEVFCNYYNVTNIGNWNGVNILIPTPTPERIEEQYNLTHHELEAILQTARERLYAQRPSVMVDSKIITAWNALMLQACAEAYRVFRDPEFLTAAKQTAYFIKNQLRPRNGRLVRSYQLGNYGSTAFLEDYAHTIEAFIALYQATFDESWLNDAKILADDAISQFTDYNSELFFYNSIFEDALLTRQIEIQEAQLPSANAVMAEALYKLGLLFYEDDLQAKAKTMVAEILPSMLIGEHRTNLRHWGSLFSLMLDLPFEVSILGNDYQKVCADFDKRYLPNVFLMGGFSEGSLEALQGKLVEGETMIYVCQDKVCKMPTPVVEEAINLLFTF